LDVPNWLITGDIVFSRIHPWLADSTPHVRAAWIKSLEQVTALHPQTLIPGHQRGGRPKDTADAVALIKTFLETFDRVRNSAPDADQFVSEMKARFPQLGQIDFLAELPRPHTRNSSPNVRRVAPYKGKCDPSACTHQILHSRCRAGS